MCAWKSAKPGMHYRNNKRGNALSPRTAQVHSCRNTLRLCVNGLPITRFRALQVCAWNAAHPALVDINKQGSKTHSASEQSCSQLQKHESSRVHTVCAWNGAGWKVRNYLSSFCFPLLAPSGKCHVLFSFTGCTAHTLAHPKHKPLLTAR